MTSLTTLRPRSQISDISFPWLFWLSGFAPHSTAVAEAVAGTGWSVHHHEAPDYETSLMLLPDDDDRFSTFVISAAGACLRLEEVRDDALHSLGRFATFGDTITRLRRAMADQTGPSAGGVTWPAGRGSGGGLRQIANICRIKG